MFLNDLVGNGQRIAVVGVLLHHDRIAGVEQIGHIAAGKDQRPTPHIGKMTGKQRLEIDVEPRFEPLFDPGALARSGEARDAHPRDFEPLGRIIDDRVPVDTQLRPCRLHLPRLPLGEGIHSADAGEKRQQGENFSPRHGILKNKGGRSQSIHLPKSNPQTTGTATPCTKP